MREGGGKGGETTREGGAGPWGKRHIDIAVNPLPSPPPQQDYGIGTIMWVRGREGEKKLTLLELLKNFPPPIV